jgi:hypothetical protein
MTIEASQSADLRSALACVNNRPERTTHSPERAQSGLIRSPLPSAVGDRDNALFRRARSACRRRPQRNRVANLECTC